VSTVRSISDLPGPAGLPIVGNAYSLQVKSMHATVEDWCRNYGPIFRFDIGRRRVIGIGDADAINVILRERPWGYRRWSEEQAIFHEVGFSGVFSEEGEGWQHARRLVVKALNSHHLHRYFHIIADACSRLYERLQQAIREDRAIDINEILGAYSADITASLAFGYGLDMLRTTDSELLTHMGYVFDMINRRLLAPIPYWRYIRLPADHALDRSVAHLSDAGERFIANARQQMALKPELRERPQNFLQAMLAAQETDGVFTNAEIVSNTLGLFVAGEDTTAYTMAWTLWFLATHPDAQMRWASEAQEVLAERLYPTQPETTDLLVYSDAVIRESMRLKSVAPALFMETLDETTVLNTRIPPGVRLWLLTRYAGILGAADDRMLGFHPERWLSCDAQRVPDSKTFLAFGAGPRFCPGRNLALLELKAGMSVFARSFVVELDDASGPVQERFSFTMIPHGLRVRLRPRAAATSVATELRR
jgi:cytochrome P450